jgi:hypothetical protein
MKTLLHVSLFTFLIAASMVGVIQAGNASGDAPSTDRAAQPKLLRISATVDGSGRMIFTRDSLTYAHLHWSPPTNVVIDGEDWSDLDTTPPAWADIAEHLDLTKAWIVKRSGRDVIALEHTPDGFDLYLSDSPNGRADYEVIIALPRTR